MHIPLANSEWVKRSLTGIMKSSFNHDLLKEALEIAGMEVQLLRWGYAWNACIITFNSVEEFSKGVPSALLRKLTEKWGQFLYFNEDQESRSDLSLAKVLLRMESPYDVPEMVTIGSYGRSFKVKTSLGSVLNTPVVEAGRKKMEKFSKKRNSGYVMSDEGDGSRPTLDANRDEFTEDARRKVISWLNYGHNSGVNGVRGEGSSSKHTGAAMSKEKYVGTKSLEGDSITNLQIHNDGERSKFSVIQSEGLKKMKKVMEDNLCNFIEESFSSSRGRIRSKEHQEGCIADPVRVDQFKANEIHLLSTEHQDQSIPRSKSLVNRRKLRIAPRSSGSACSDTEVSINFYDRVYRRVWRSLVRDSLEQVKEVSQSSHSSVKARNEAAATREAKFDSQGISEDISELESKINGLELKLQGGGISIQERDLLILSRNELWKLHRKEESILLQRSRLKWNMEGDRNTSSQATLEVEDINLNFVKLSEEQKSGLEVEFSEQEVWEAVFHSDSSKAPGPDGFTMGFFKKLWPIMKDHLLKFVDDFHRGRSWKHGVNHAFITLIPKKLNPKGIEDYKPISLVGSLYKIISKILSRRLVSVIKDLISPSQFAFILAIKTGLIKLSKLFKASFIFHPSFHLIFFHRRSPTSFIIVLQPPSVVRHPPSAVRHPPSTATFRHPYDRRYLPFLPSAVVSSSYDLRARLSLAIFSFSVLAFSLAAIPRILPCNQKRPPVIAPPSSAASPSLPNHHSHHDKVRTIFISGLPTDVKERELQNLLRWLPGFEASQVSFKGKEPKGFALFSIAKFAVAAKDTLQEMVFDAKLKSLLHIEMAKKNLVVKKGMGTDSVAVDIYSCHPVPPVLPAPNPAPGASPSIHVHDKSGCYVEKSTAVAVQDGSGESTTKDCINDKSGCFTLFIDNLPEKNHWKRFGSLFCSHGRSGMEDVSSKNHYKVEGVIDEEKLQVLSNCLVGWCKDFVKIGHLARQMQSKGLTGFTLMRAAGNALLMIFEDNVSLRSLKNDKSKILAEWFSIVEAWSESLVMECRRVWLVCEGVPFHAWNWNTFKNIADKWGLLLAIDESCQSPSSFDRAKIQVLTKADARIDSMVELKVGDNFFKVMVHEIEPSFKPNSWAPEEYKSH
ncbi:Detected protein of unknown function [Hibiscus syriacus]|uniref:Uncharacterized protein n=1 Tax=Hibiscus syriacus TaxID=106335 RepID=A0A6A2X783_HIBSY|nr:Detected protein of unknown function [Hibiscus syriacus]